MEVSQRALGSLSFISTDKWGERRVRRRVAHKWRTLSLLRCRSRLALASVCAPPDPPPPPPVSDQAQAQVARAHMHGWGFCVTRIALIHYFIFGVFFHFLHLAFGTTVGRRAPGGLERAARGRGVLPARGARFWLRDR
jgi:hypothetical protein